MTLRRTTALAVATAGIVASGLLVAPSAQAYPPGTRSEVRTNKAVYKAGQKVKAAAVQVKPGCKVTFRWKAKGKGNDFNKTRTDRANKNGVARAKLGKGPKKPGKYKVLITQSGGKGCNGTSTTSFRVLKRPSGGLG